ncbi:MAG TPA: hypothetical protein VF093_03855 [Solirubrobacterales bacterium]
MAHECAEIEQDFRVTFPGPFEHHDVVVDGWRVPFLQAHMAAEDRVSLVIDRRLATELSVEEAERVVPFVAHAISVALGYTCHPKGDREPLHKPQPRPVRSVGVMFPTGEASER